MDHRTTAAIVGGWRRRRRNRLQGPPPKWSDVRGRLHMRLKDAAAELNVPMGCLRRLCRKNGYPNWPGKRIRYMKSIGEDVMPLESLDARDGSPWAGLAGPSHLVPKIVKTQKEDEDDMTRFQTPDLNHPPADEELITFNLIEKVGSSSSS